jgi:hypothetical protein
MKFKYHEDGTLPTGNEVFVFGSNLAGIHGAGAAKVAKEKFGAVYQLGIGRSGQSYAIPTKDFSIRTMSINQIEQHILDFCEFTHTHPHLDFFVTRVGCGLAGFNDNQIAPLFKTANENCNFPNEWKEYLS